MWKNHPYLNEIKIETVMSLIIDRESDLILFRELKVSHSVFWIRYGSINKVVLSKLLIIYG
jgi:hypothetical protein